MQTTNYRFRDHNDNSNSNIEPLQKMGAWRIVIAEAYLERTSAWEAARTTRLSMVVDFIQCGWFGEECLMVNEWYSSVDDGGSETVVLKWHRRP